LQPLNAYEPERSKPELQLNIIHHVKPVTRGERVSSFFWIQSMVRDDGERSLLFNLDLGIQQVVRNQPDSNTGVQLTGVYHNLLRRWASV
jgi:PKHD-type hydroxylase